MERRPELVAPDWVRSVADRLTRRNAATQYPISAVRAAPSLTPLKPGPASRASGKAWLYRLLAAVGIPVLFFLGLEGGLRLGGFGRTVRFLIPDEKPGFFRSNPDFVSSFLPSSFDLRPLNFRIAARKPPNAVRIVVLGESAAQGIPAPPFGFAAQLRAQLRARYPEKEIEVINTGIVAINSHVVYQIARELSGFSPDLFVVYMGNNEVVGPYGPGCAYLSEMPPLWLIRLSFFVRSTRTGQLFNALAGKLARHGRPPAEWGGMSMFANNAVPGDDPRLEAVYRNLEGNLSDIVRVATKAGAKVLLCTVASNLKDCAPLLSLHRAGFSAAEAPEWGTVFNRGRIEWLLGESEGARADLARALDLDPHYADTLYLLGSLELQWGAPESARNYLVQAEHWDALRFRPDPRINEVIRKVASFRSGQVALLDTALLLGSDPASRAPPAGRELFFEHVHPDWEGSYQLARAMAEAAETALYGDRKGAFPWLDSAGCAAALAYTPHERLAVLERLTAIVQNPPFNNQLTYCEDQARLARDRALAKSRRSDPEALGRARGVAAAASKADPANPDLAKIEEEILDDSGDLAGALAQARRAQELQPRNFALATDEAIKLSRLGRYDEAEMLLKQTALSCSPKDRATMAPAFADLYTRTRRFEEGRRYLDGEISRNPDDEGLQLARARLEGFAGNEPGAERDLRGLLEKNPGSAAALEELVGLLGKSAQDAAAERESLSAVDRQPRNLANDLRAAIAYDSRGDDGNFIKCLLAAEQCGPVTSGIEFRLAQKLFAARRLDDTLAHLAQARRISEYEGNPAVTASIERAIQDIRSQMR
jgi:Flp pilus assembly protein TadD